MDAVRSLGEGANFYWWLDDESEILNSFAVNFVPEPATIALLHCGLPILFLFDALRRRTFQVE